MSPVHTSKTSWRRPINTVPPSAPGRDDLRIVRTCLSATNQKIGTVYPSKVLATTEPLARQHPTGWVGLYARQRYNRSDRTEPVPPLGGTTSVSSALPLQPLDHGVVGAQCRAIIRELEGSFQFGITDFEFDRKGGSFVIWSDNRL